MPMEMLGTKCPSITSTWSSSAPPFSMARTASPRAAKSAARMEGAISSGGLIGRTHAILAQASSSQLQVYDRAGNDTAAPRHGLADHRAALLGRRGHGEEFPEREPRGRQPALRIHGHQPAEIRHYVGGLGRPQANEQIHAR